MRVGANRQKRCMSEADHSRIANEQHQADASDGIDEDLRELTEIKGVEHERRREQQSGQQAVPEQMPGMLKER